MAIKSLKTIKRLHALADASTPEVVNYNFRSLDEIKQFLKGLATKTKDFTKQFNDLKKQFTETSAITIKKVSIKRDGDKKKSLDTDKIEFVAPDLKRLRSSFKVVDQMHEKVEALDATIHSLMLNFKGVAGSQALINEAKRLRKSLQDQLDKAYSFLESVATKHEPKKFADVAKDITKDLFATFNGMYETSTQKVYVTPYVKGENEKILFTHYVDFKNFRNDEDQTIDHVFVVLSCVIDFEGNSTFFVTSMQDFAPPGKFNLGQQFKTVQEGKTKAYIQLEAQNFSTLLERTTIPATDNEIRDIDWNVPKGWIDWVKLEDNVIEVLFTKKVTEANRDKAVQHVLLDLKAFFAGRIKAGVKHRSYKLADGRLGEEFTLILPDRKHMKQVRVSHEKLTMLKQKLGLSEKQAVGLVKYLNGLAADETEDIE